MFPNLMTCMELLMHGSIMQAGGNTIRAPLKPQAVVGKYLIEQAFSKWLHGVPSESESNAAGKTVAEIFGVRKDVDKLYEMAQAANNKSAGIVVESSKVQELRKSADSRIDILKTVIGQARARVADLKSYLRAETLMQLREHGGEVV